MLFKKFYIRYIHRAPSRKKSSDTAIFGKLVFILGLFIVAYFAIFIPTREFLKNTSGTIALSDATDIVTATINNTIVDKMSDGIYDYNYFVNLEKNDQGEITAISANMVRINTLSAEILREIIGTTGTGEINLEIPLGNLMDSNILIGRGPDIPIKIIMLTSSYSDFRNELISAGINQTKHQILLEIRVEIDVLLPWEIRSTEVVSEVLIAETIIVGEVPQTYFGLQ